MGTLKKHSTSIFGHTHVFTGYYRDQPYFRISESGVVDGIGREHLSIYARCDVCDKEIKIGMAHKPNFK